MDVSTSKNLIAIIRENSWIDKNKFNPNTKYLVTAIDRMNNESKPSNMAE
jgi:hypothetical protein